MTIELEAFKEYLNESNFIVSTSENSENAKIKIKNLNMISLS